MSRWTNPEEWERYYRAETCPVCLRGRPTDAVAELEATYLQAGEDAPMRGYCFLMLKRHAVELYELGPDEAAAFMRDVQRTARAVQSLMSPVKLNYEIHGNTVPHLHLHLFPRYVGDPFENQPVNPRLVRTPVYAAGEFGEFRERLRAAVSR